MKNNLAKRLFIVVFLIVLSAVFLASCSGREEKIDPSKDNTDILEGLTLLEKSWIEKAMPLSEFFGYDKLTNKEKDIIKEEAKESFITISYEGENILGVHSEYMENITFGKLVSSPLPNLILPIGGEVQYSLANDYLFFAFYLDVENEDFTLFTDSLKSTYHQTLSQGEEYYLGTDINGLTVFATFDPYALSVLFARI